ncbi:hypothetical protein HYS54_05035 [Candidatus Micrarchaeota archaeon]|nr:hypothetical protein [Candidatus Micrarchaeota archaeon]
MRSRRAETGRRGQTSFEFILVIAITLLVVGSVAFDVADEAGKTFVLSEVKKVASFHSARAARSAGCEDVAFRSAQLDEAAGTLEVSFTGDRSCRQFILRRIADDVESSCGATPNGDTFIDCNLRVSLTGG